MGGIVTHYGAQYNGQPLGCGKGTYASADTSIIAVGPARNREWPCGTLISVCGPTGCILTVRQDSCPGCGPYHADLSEAGIARVCGEGVGLCKVELQVMREVRLPVPGQSDPSHEDYQQAASQ
ncbi:MAG: hypothetical protein GEU75_09260 [Dehalococcoidia bacterium]|nr:hypothetical protein [Dehalococcoidia bacterium]